MKVLLKHHILLTLTKHLQFPLPATQKTTFSSQSLQLQIQVFILTTDLGKV